ncbi:MAG: glycosyltransferase family 2 protein [Thermoanaerobaculaceae bacterium]|nr:glycosyltransferase family 2 protein [Thermoanaerobaculaceae bacterium]HPW54133.1 glycosyltransferase family 2 protein [Thermoanaerobaculaceae bacterium]
MSEEGMSGHGTGPEVELTILMPCLNEAETIETCVRKARSYLDGRGITGEVLVADNGSTDGSPALAEQAGARVVPVRDRGYGNALLGGILAARGRFVIMGDADDSYDFLGLDPFVERLRAGDQLVMGNRFAGGIRRGAMPPLHRYLGNPLLSFIGRSFFGSRCGDFYCGLRGFDRDAVLGLDLRTTGMEFALEMVVKATLSGLRVAEVPTTLSPDGRTTSPKLRTWRDGWRSLRFFLLLSPRWLFLLPGATLITVGVLVGGWLLPGPRRVGSVSLDVHTLLYAAAAVTVGFQAALFGVLTRVFAASEGLLPPSPRLDRTLRWFPLEVGLGLGAALLLAGLGGSVWAVWLWEARGFGDLDPFRMLRTVIPSVLAVTLGVELVLASFFLSVLRLRRR